MLGATRNGGVAPGLIELSFRGIYKMEPIPENEIAALSSLCRAAMTLEKLLIMCFQENPELMEKVAKPHLELIDFASKTIGHWRQYLEIADE